MKTEDLKIVFFLDYGADYGGAVNTILQQACLLKKMGHTVIVFVSDYAMKKTEKNFQEKCEGFDITLHHAVYPICTHTEDIDIVSVVDNYDGLFSEIREIAPDILHSVQLNPIAELVSRELHIPHIMNIYPVIEDFFQVSYFPIIPYYHICDSMYYAKKWHEYASTDSVCIRTVMPRQVRKEYRQVNEKIVCLCVGTVYKEKNQYEVVRAFHKILQSGIGAELFVCGYDEREYAKLCHKYINEHKLEKEIHMTGFCKDMKEMYRRADILICGSTRESYPNVISEAMAYGLAIVTTPVAGVLEVLKDGVNGYISKGYDADSLCVKIEEAFRDYKSGRIIEIQKNAYRTFEHTHTEDIVRGQLINFYNHVLAENCHLSDFGIGNVRKLFDRWIRIYRKYQNKFKNPDDVRVKIWYLAHIQPMMEQANREGKEFFIWGAGDLAVNALQIMGVFFANIKLQGFIDSYKKGEKFQLPIYQPDIILKRDDNVILVCCVKGQKEIMDILKETGRVYGRDFFLLALREW